MTPAEVLREAQDAGLGVSIAPSGNLYVQPAERLVPELRALLLEHKDALLDHLRQTSAANDPGKAGAWIERRRVTGHEGMNPTTLAKFAAASEDLDRKMLDAGAPAAPVRDCYPHDPSPDAAMNGAELELFARRLLRLLALGLDGGAADVLADKLVRRDREGDDRVSCAECVFVRAGACPGGHPLPLAVLHRCEFVPLRRQSSASD